MPQRITFPALVEAARATPPDVALVLGSGLGMLADRLTEAQSVPFADVPGLAGTSVAGHKGCVTLGHWAGRRVLLFEGRVHRYEGHAWRTVLEPAHLAQRLGARVLILTNAAGGIHEALAPGTLMALRDHIDLTHPCAWRQAVSSPYSPRLRELLMRAAERCDIAPLAGTYAQVTGPCYETPAEIRALRAWGADAVGMSTAREAAAAYDIGMECAALSCITN